MGFFLGVASLGGVRSLDPPWHWIAAPPSGSGRVEQIFGWKILAAWASSRPEAEGEFLSKRKPKKATSSVITVVEPRRTKIFYDSPVRAFHMLACQEGGKYYDIRL